MFDAIARANEQCYARHHEQALLSMYRISLENCLGGSSLKDVVAFAICWCLLLLLLILLYVVATVVVGFSKRIRWLNGNGIWCANEWRCSECVVCCVPNLSLLNAHSRDLIKMCESMTIITLRLDKYLPIEYFNECYFARRNAPASIGYSRSIDCN